ncbi:diguanylate cyclase [Roseovarius amoyensis]|uniref:diguanylate cyclase n=1 Tax=Roseovarius amoyensis TaxID=2211448 RepID=UPI0013A68E39|nr:diguanylate cyclase [Roseovarius amoyensis]
MTGKILIVDALATNRIVLKARLTAAFYEVLQAGSGAEAATVARDARPDLLLLGGALPDIGVGELVTALAEGCGPDCVLPTVVALLPDDAAAQRADALAGGASDVISRPVDHRYLLARLRALLRQRHLDADLGVPAATADALGFAEEPCAFRPPARLTVMAGTAARAHTLRQRLAPALPDVTCTFAEDGTRAMAALRRGTDAVLLEVGETNLDTAPALLAELQTAPATRHARIVVLLDRAAADLAVPLLDMGASEVLPTPVDDRELTLRISAQIAHKTRADVLRGRLESGLQAAVIDPLTGLYNRRYGLSFLRRILAQPQGGGGLCAVMVADLDHFKAINDGFGHAAGDRVLAQVSARMRANLPAGAIIARLGGEEFVIVVPDTSPDAARRLAGTICRHVREKPVTMPGGAGAVAVTVSIGVTLALPDPAAGPAQAEALLAEADRALYASKSGGRNTVTFRCRPAA